MSPGQFWAVLRPTVAETRPGRRGYSAAAWAVPRPTVAATRPARRGHPAASRRCPTSSGPCSGQLWQR
eukprot:5959234-Alexandrium_andersonii.AAC.1